MWNDSTYFGIKSGWANDVPKGIDYGLDDFPIFHEKGEENLFVPHGLAGSGDSLVGPKGVGPALVFSDPKVVPHLNDRALRRRIDARDSHEFPKKVQVWKGSKDFLHALVEFLGGHFGFGIDKSKGASLGGSQAFHALDVLGVLVVQIFSNQLDGGRCVLGNGLVLAKFLVANLPLSFHAMSVIIVIGGTINGGTCFRRNS